MTVPDWQAIGTEVLRVAPARPALGAHPALPIPRGPARLELDGAVPNAACRCGGAGAFPLSVQALSLAPSLQHGTSPCLVVTFLPVTTPAV